MRPNTKLLFAETPTNPLTEVCDIQALADIAHDAGALLAVDNCMCSPALQQPVKFGADIVMHSGTKFLDGQGRVNAGALCAPLEMVEGKFVPVMRSAGMSLSPFNAWVVAKGLETLSVRVLAQSASTLALAQWLETHPAVARVWYPGLPSHPQHELAMRQQNGSGGAVLSFDVKGGREAGLRRHRRHARLQHRRQLRRRAQHHHPPRQHHAWPAQRGAAPGGRHRPGHDPPGRGPGTPRRPEGRPRAWPGCAARLTP